MCDTNSSLEGKVVIVTGGSAGIGLAAAKNIAKRGARVIIASRNEMKLKKARDEIEEATGNSDIAYRMLDLGSLKSVRNFASETVNSENRLDVLVNNAGAVGLPDKLSEDGLHLSMQVNYFGTFLLTYLLLPMLKASAPSRIISSSAASKFIGNIDFDHWNDIGRDNSVTILANCQLALSLFTAEIDRRFKKYGVTANTYDPFIVKNTNLFDNAPSGTRELFQLFYNTVGQPQETVGEQIGSLAADPKLERVSGGHYKFCGPWINHWLTQDPELTMKIWEESKKAVNIKEEEDWEAIDDQKNDF